MANVRCIRGIAAGSTMSLGRTNMIGCPTTSVRLNRKAPTASPAQLQEQAFAG
jgi:hypothetical protein